MNVRTKSRRHALAAVLTAWVVAAVTALVGTSTATAHEDSCSGDSWRQFHAGATKTGWNCGEDRIGTDNVSTLAARWSAGANAFTSSPVVRGDRVYFTSESVTSTTDTTSLYSVRRSDGSTVWSTPLAASPIVPPGALAYADGRILLVVDGALQAYRSDTGALSWSKQVGQSRGPTVRDHTAYLGTSDHTVLAVSTSSGATRWTTTVPGEVSSELAVTDDRVFVAGGTELSALKTSTGAVRWHRTIGEVYGGGTAVRGDTVYVAANVPSEGGGAVLYAISTGSGHVRWSAPAGDDVHSVPAVDDHNVYIGSIGSELRAFSHGGSLRWTRTFGGEEIWSSVASANGVVYLSTDTDHAYAVRARTGGVLFADTPSANAGFAGLASPAVTDGRVYFAFGNSGVVCYGLRHH